MEAAEVDALDLESQYITLRRVIGSRLANHAGIVAACLPA